MDETFSRLADVTPAARTHVGRMGAALRGWLSGEVCARLLGCITLVCSSPAQLLQIPTGDKRINLRWPGTRWPETRWLEYRHGLPCAQDMGGPRCREQSNKLSALVGADALPTNCVYRCGLG